MVQEEAHEILENFRMSFAKKVELKKKEIVQDEAKQILNNFRNSFNVKVQKKK